MKSKSSQVWTHVIALVLFLGVLSQSGVSYYQDRRLTDEGFVALGTLVIVIGLSVSLFRILRRSSDTKGQEV